jgi:hypothetical protein
VWTVPVRLRPLASGLGTVAPHLLGDVPILPIVGWVQGSCPSCILPAGITPQAACCRACLLC